MSNTISTDPGSAAYDKVMQDLSPESHASDLDIEADAFRFLVDTDGGTAEHSQLTGQAMQQLGNAASAGASGGEPLDRDAAISLLERGAALDHRALPASTQQPDSNVLPPKLANAPADDSPV